MAFINTTAHQKFVYQCHEFIAALSENGKDIAPDEKAERFKAELAELQQLVETYMNTISKLPLLSAEYYTLQRSMRIKLRKMQLVKSKSMPDKRS